MEATCATWLRIGKMSCAVKYCRDTEGKTQFKECVDRGQASWAMSRRTPLRFQRTSPPLRLRRSPTRACSPWKSSATRNRRSFRLSPSRIRERQSPPQHRADAVEPALRGQDPFRRLLSVVGGVRQKALPDAWSAPGIGAPTNNRNAFKHGVFTRQAIEERKQVQALLRQSRKLLQDIE